MPWPMTMVTGTLGAPNAKADPEVISGVNKDEDRAMVKYGPQKPKIPS